MTSRIVVYICISLAILGIIMYGFAEKDSKLMITKADIPKGFGMDTSFEVIRTYEDCYIDNIEGHYIKDTTDQMNLYTFISVCTVKIKSKDDTKQAQLLVSYGCVISENLEKSFICYSKNK